MTNLNLPACRWLGQWQGGDYMEMPDNREPPPGWQSPCPADGPPAVRGALTFDPRADAGREDARTPDSRGDVFGRGE